VGTHIKRGEAALADCEAGEEVEGDGGDTEPTRDAGEYGQQQRDGAYLDERQGGIAARGGENRRHASRSARSRRSPSGVPTATTPSPGSSTTSGLGAGSVSSLRTSATTDVPVRVRSCPSPIVAPLCSAP